MLKLNAFRSCPQCFVKRVGLSVWYICPLTEYDLVDKSFLYFIAQSQHLSMRKDRGTDIISHAHYLLPHIIN